MDTIDAMLQEVLTDLKKQGMSEIELADIILFLKRALQELLRQWARWGGVRRDSSHTNNDFVAMIARQDGEAAFATGEQFYDQMVKVAALTVAAMLAQKLREGGPENGTNA